MDLAAGAEVERLRAAWLTHLEATGLRRGSLATYRSAISDYMRYLAYYGIKYDEVSSQDLDRWKLQLVQVRKIKPSTVNYYKSGLKSFYEWLEREGYCFNSPVLRMKGMKAPRLLPKPIPQEDCVRLIEAAEDGKIRAMLELFYGLGLRHDELRLLNVGDVDLEGGRIRVMGKGQKERIMPLAGKALECLRLYLAGVDDPDRPLWPGHREGSRMDQKTIRKALRDCAERAGVKGHIHPHRLRHSFATHMLDWGMRLEGVQQLMGHAKISTTMIYTEVAKEKVAQEYREIHRRAKLEG